MYREREMRTYIVLHYIYTLCIFILMYVYNVYSIRVYIYIYIMYFV